jgi:DivIVA domain-containing protein
MTQIMQDGTDKMTVPQLLARSAVQFGYLGSWRRSGGLLMGILHNVTAWEYIVVAALFALPAVYKLVRSRHIGEISTRAWSALGLSLVFLGEGILFFLYANRPWLDWGIRSFAVGQLATLAVPGIVSRKRAGLRWWRFWGRVIPPPSEAASVSLGSGPAGTLGASTLGLIERIKTAKFGTTRRSGGYDEEEVDIFLDKLVEVLSEGRRLNRAELCNATFTATRLRPGYVAQDVDSFLHEIAAATF